METITNWATKKVNGVLPLNFFLLDLAIYPPKSVIPNQESPGNAGNSFPMAFHS
jgi:hypothetical protein